MHAGNKSTLAEVSYEHHSNREHSNGINGIKNFGVAEIDGSVQC